MSTITIIYLKIDQKVAGLIQKNIYKAIAYTEKFLNIKIEDLKIVIATDKKHYDRLLKIERPSWGVTTQKKGIIYLYNPLLWTKVNTGHNINDLESSLIHELVHSYFFKEDIISPKWFEEGLAIKVADGKKMEKENDFNKLALKNFIPNIIILKSNFSNTNIPIMYYLTSFMFVDFLFKKYGIYALTKFIFSLKNKNAFEHQFRKFFFSSSKNVWLEFKKGIVSER